MCHILSSRNFREELKIRDMGEGSVPERPHREGPS